jgi:hypothetical protein
MDIGYTKRGAGQLVRRGSPWPNLIHQVKCSAGNAPTSIQHRRNADVRIGGGLSPSRHVTEGIKKVKPAIILERGNNSDLSRGAVSKGKPDGCETGTEEFERGFHGRSTDCRKLLSGAHLMLAILSENGFLAKVITELWY